MCVILGIPIIGVKGKVIHLIVGTVPAPDLPSSQRWTCSGSWSFREATSSILGSTIFIKRPVSAASRPYSPAVLWPICQGRPSRFQGTRGGCYGGLDSRGNAVSHCKEYRRKYCSIPADFSVLSAPCAKTDGHHRNRVGSFCPVHKFIWSRIHWIQLLSQAGSR